MFKSTTLVITMLIRKKHYCKFLNCHNFQIHLNFELSLFVISFTFGTYYLHLVHSPENSYGYTLYTFTPLFSFILSVCSVGLTVCPYIMPLSTNVGLWKIYSYNNAPLVLTKIKTLVLSKIYLQMLQLIGLKVCSSNS